MKLYRKYFSVFLSLLVPYQSQIFSKCPNRKPKITVLLKGTENSKKEEEELNFGTFWYTVHFKSFAILFDFQSAVKLFFTNKRLFVPNGALTQKMNLNRIVFKLFRYQSFNARDLIFSWYPKNTRYWNSKQKKIKMSV